MLTIEIILLLITTWGLLLTRARAWVWTSLLAIALIIFTDLSPYSSVAHGILWAIFLIIALLVNVKILRRGIITERFFVYFKRSLPPMSHTEREAIEAGDVWWEGELFQGRPDWNKFHGIPKPRLTAEEQAFLENEVQTLCHMLDDWKIVHEHHDMPPEIWQYLKEQRFFGLVIKKQYGGRGFSALAHSTVIATLATRSLSTAINTMVPNSLGPGELLYHYGTDEQKQYYLPRLANGEDIPCFALTSTEAGSDAGAMQDKGVICKGQHKGEEVLGIRLSWDKRYITLAPVATLVGIAFKLSDPEHLLGNETELGITVCLIPASHPGVEMGKRHYPMGLAFMNGPTRGKDVFIPLDWVIGGKKMVGRGWRMLMECLSMGRGISLPALGVAGGMLNLRSVTAYGKIRQQFRVSLTDFEGVQTEIAKITGNTYMIQAMRLMTAGAIDLNVKPAVASAIVKYHSSEMSRELFNSSMDIHAGRAIQFGPRNYMGNAYMGLPVGITVEGANILTRNLIIFGQGSIRCHPYVLKEMLAAMDPNPRRGLREFDQAFIAHIGYVSSNVTRVISLSLTNAKLVQAPHSPLAYYYRQLTRMSSALAMTADFAMLALGGSLKRREALSARLGDILSYLYIATAVLKYHADEKSPTVDLPVVKWCLETCLCKIQVAFDEFFRNFPRRMMAKTLRFCIFPYGRNYYGPRDALNSEVVKTITESMELRNRLTNLCYSGDANQPIGRVDHAYELMLKAESVQKKLYNAIKQGFIERNLDLAAQLAAAEQQGLLNTEEIGWIQTFALARYDALSVDEFEKDYFIKGEA